MAASCANYLFLLFLASPAFTVSNLMSPGEAQNIGFSAELIHRDSPKSPFYNASESHSQRLNNAFRHSLSRAYHFNRFAPQADIIPVPGEYVMKISVGTPPFEILPIADTGSDLIWTQCKPCMRCFKQVAPLFDPMSSSTYKKLSCFSNTCKYLNGTRTKPAGTFCPVRSHNHHDDSCLYYYIYGSGSTKGQLATDTLTLSSTTGHPVPFPKTLIGCGRDDHGSFNNEETGIVGLGRGAISLISQMAPLINGKFSYCLVSKSESSSKIHFGTNAVVSGPEVVSTPLVKNNISKSFYSLTLKAMSVDNERIEFFGSAFGKERNIILDSGTTFTILPKNFYSKLEWAMVSKIKAVRVADPYKVLSLCFEVEPHLELPTITVHFAGADVKLQPINFFKLRSETIVCFTFIPIDGIAIYGNLAQKNFLIGYDTVKETVSFKPMDCSKM